jgi:hypothetical protein
VATAAVSKLGDDEETQERTTGLARVIENAAMLGDARGDDSEAARLLRNGLEDPSMPRIERARALLYLAELYARLGDEPSCPRVVVCGVIRRSFGR